MFTEARKEILDFIKTTGQPIYEVADLAGVARSTLYRIIRPDGGGQVRSFEKVLAYVRRIKKRKTHAHKD